MKINIRAWDDISNEMIYPRPEDLFFDGDVHKRFNNCMLRTPFKDKKHKWIYDGDILGDWNNIDGKMEQSKMQVFFCNEVGAWKLDNSYLQDKSSGDLLSDELALSAYEITGNIYEQHCKGCQRIKNPIFSACLCSEMVGVEFY